MSLATGYFVLTGLQVAGILNPSIRLAGLSAEVLEAEADVQVITNDATYELVDSDLSVQPNRSAVIETTESDVDA